MGLLTAVILAGPAALASGLPMGWTAPGTPHASMSAADHSAHVSGKGGRHDLGKTRHPCVAGMADASMMSICHPELITDNVNLSAPEKARRHVLGPDRDRSGMTMEILTPPPKHVL